MLYSDESLAAVQQKLNRRLAVLYAVLCAGLAVFVWLAVIRAEIPAIVAFCVTGCFLIFWLNMFCMPLVKYRRLIRTALHGRSHTRTLEFAGVEPEESVIDGVVYRSLLFLGEPDKHGTREQQLYWDRELPLPDFQPGQQVTLQITDRMIIGVLTEDPSSRP